MTVDDLVQDTAEPPNVTWGDDVLLNQLTALHIKIQQWNTNSWGVSPSFCSGLRKGDFETTGDNDLGTWQI